MVFTLIADSTLPGRVGMNFRGARESHTNPLYPSTPKRPVSPSNGDHACSPSKDHPGMSVELSGPSTPLAAFSTGDDPSQPSSLLVLVLACFLKVPHSYPKAYVFLRLHAFCGFLMKQSLYVLHLTLFRNAHVAISCLKLRTFSLQHRHM